MMTLKFIKKEFDKAYVADQLWVPKAKINVASVKKSLEFEVQGRDRMIKKFLWAESRNHLICPREFIPSKNYPNFPFPFVDLRPKFQKIHFDSLVKPRNEEQKLATDALLNNENGILNLACGKGKTVLSTVKIAEAGVPTLVIVPDGAILNQWQETILGNPATGREPALKFDGELGLIKGPVFNWAKPITLALVTTLWMRLEEGSVPEEMLRYFGLIFFDECHQIGAAKFSLTAAPFYGDRIGLTATVKREDGLDPIYLYHIGHPFYSDLTQDLKPRVYFQQTPIQVDMPSEDDLVNVSQLRGSLGSNKQANIYRYFKIKESLDTGRKVLCLSHSKKQLFLMQSLFPGSATITKETPQEKRMEVLRNSNPCFAISRLGSVGIDDAALDTLFWLTPFTSKIGAQQSIGRVQREHKDKKTPVVVVFEEHTNSIFRKMCWSLRRTIKGLGLDYEICKPEKLDLTLPPDLDAAYEKIAVEQDDEVTDD
jgi:superfamily II DNA or RNA helicase